MRSHYYFSQTILFYSWSKTVGWDFILALALVTQHPGISPFPSVLVTLPSFLYDIHLSSISLLPTLKLPLQSRYDVSRKFLVKCFYNAFSSFNIRICTAVLNWFSIFRIFPTFYYSSSRPRRLKTKKNKTCVMKETQVLLPLKKKKVFFFLAYHTLLLLLTPEEEILKADPQSFYIYIYIFQLYQFM